jgi:flagellar biosynthesis protein FliQ
MIIWLLILCSLVVMLIISVFRDARLIDEQEKKLVELTKILIKESVIDTRDSIHQPKMHEDYLDLLDKYTEQKEDEYELMGLAKAVNEGQRLLKGIKRHG